MDDETRQLLSKRNAMGCRVPSRHFRRDVDVADERTTFSGSSEPERYHIRAPAVIEMSAVQRGDTAIVHESDRQSSLSDTLGAEHGTRDCRDALPGERDADAVIFDKYDIAHTDANSDVTPPLDVG